MTPDYSVLEGNVLFNDTLNTLYLLLYSVEHMVRDHSDRERENPLLFLISSKESFICIIPQTGYEIPWPLLHQSWNTGCSKRETTQLIHHFRYTSNGTLAEMKNSSTDRP